jgi:hypothetical protein
MGQERRSSRLRRRVATDEIAGSTQILPTYVRPLDENTGAVIEGLNADRKKQRVVPHSIN